MKKSLMFLLVLTMLLPAVNVFASGQAEAVEEEMVKDVIIALPGDVTTWNPFLRNEVITNSIQRHVFESLIESAPDLTPIPGLALSWEANNDASVWTIKLREGVKFHNGNAFDADDVVFSFDLCKSDGRGWADSLGNFESWRAVDEYTVEVKTIVPDVLLPSNLRNIVMVDKETLEGTEPDFIESNVVGTGRYKLIEYVKDDRVTFMANEDYWGDAPDIKRVIFRSIPESGTRSASLLTGEVDLISNVPVRDAKMLQTKDNVKVVTAAGISTLMFAMGQTEENPSINSLQPIKSPDGSNPMAVRDVRRAIIHAINEDEIMDKIMGGFASPAPTPVPEGFNGYNPSLKKYEYDPEKAERLLDNAGYPRQADGYRFEITLDATNDRYINDAAIATAVAVYLEKVGIKCNPNVMSRSVFWGYVRMRDGFNSHFVMSAWSEPSAESALIAKDMIYSSYLDKPKREGWGGVNRGYYSNEKVDELIEEALATVDYEKRDEIMQEAWKIAWDDAALFTLHSENAIYATSMRVEYSPRVDQFIMAWDLKLIK